MALSPTAIKYIAIGVLVVLLAMFVGALLWDILKIALGILVGGGLIYLGVRFLLGKGLPKSMENAAKKVVDAGKEAK
ncbi:MAG: hypothetical protein KF754_13985 [Planctomycetes bacterium]|nr:hypothetical protein [Planctomycetota bacterium]